METDSTAPAPPTAADGPAIDEAALAQLREDYTDVGGPSFVPELVEAYLDSAREAALAVRAALLGRDGVQLARTAHRLKGSAASFGAHRLTTLCERLEALGKEGALHEAPKVVADFESELARVRTALEPHRAVS